MRWGLESACTRLEMKPCSVQHLKNHNFRKGALVLSKLLKSSQDRELNIPKISGSYSSTRLGSATSHRDLWTWWLCFCAPMSISRNLRMILLNRTFKCRKDWLCNLEKKWASFVITNNHNVLKSWSSLQLTWKRWEFSAPFLSTSSRSLVLLLSSCHRWLSVHHQTKQQFVCTSCAYSKENAFPFGASLSLPQISGKVSYVV